MSRKRRSASQARKTIGYVRVSTEDQASKSVSIEAQEARIRAFAIATDRALDAIVINHGISAKTLVRPGITRIIAGVKSGAVGTPPRRSRRTRPSGGPGPSLPAKDLRFWLNPACLKRR